MHINSIAEFEVQWKALANQVGKKIVEDPQIVEIKKQLGENGFLTAEEKSTFITIADKIKYDLIYEKYGEHDTEGYNEFKKFWQEWLSVKGVASQQVTNKSQENANHFMYGSTPDPEIFLTEFDPEENS
jgi:hypothetical protein